MARVNHRQRKNMENTTEAPTTTSILLSSSTTPHYSTTSVTSDYSTDSEFAYNYSTGGLDYLNYTGDGWPDLWNISDTINATLKSNISLVLTNSDNYCSEWEAAQHKLFQAANIFFAAAFLIPRSFKVSILALRTLLTIGFMLSALWAGIAICALDAMLWFLLLGMLNGIQSLILACRFLPPALSPELADLYLKLFKTYKISKKHFQELAKEARVFNLEPGQTYATEGVTQADERLSILLRGKMRVTCENTHLHYIRDYQFIDSLEWEATHESINDVFQVTIRAEEPSTYICWTRLKLLRVLRHRPLLKIVLNTLVGKDITIKLYALNEQLAGVAAAHERALTTPYRGVVRSASADAVDTETAGQVRSSIWKTQKRHSTPRSERSLPGKHSHYFCTPVVANHFPQSSPFAQAQNAGYSLLPQGELSPPQTRTPSHTPLTRQRSGGGTGGDYTLLPHSPVLERKRSKKTAREVKFDTPL